MANTIFYKTTADFGNTGEVLIYKSLLELLRMHGNVIVDDKNPKAKEFLQKIKIQDSERLSNFSKLPFIFACLVHGNFLVTGIGQHFLSSNKAAIKNFLSILFLIIARICRVKIIRLGMSIEIKGFLCGISERLLASFCYLYAVRDSISLDIVKKSGIRKATLLPDLSFAYKIESKKENKNSCLALVFNSFRGLYLQWQKPIENIVDKFLIDNPNGYIYIGFQVSIDEKHSKYLYSLLYKKFQDKVSFNKELITLENAHEFYGKCKYVISNRLHSLLLCYKFGALPVPLIHKEKNHKITGIFNDAGLNDWIRYIDEENYSLPNYEEIEKIYVVEKRYMEELERILKLIFEQPSLNAGS